MCMKCCNFPCKLSWVMCIYLNILIFFILRFNELTEIISIEVFSHQYLRLSICCQQNPINQLCSTDAAVHFSFLM